jgi:hypothetical protein
MVIFSHPEMPSELCECCMGYILLKKRTSLLHRDHFVVKVVHFHYISTIALPFLHFDF